MKFNKSLFSSLLFVVAFSFFGNAVSENELNPEGRSKCILLYSTGVNKWLFLSNS